MPAYIDRFETGSLSYSTGDRALIRVRMSEAVIVDTRFGVPILALSNGSTAQYVSGSGTEVLEFEYIVDENDLASRDLRVVALAENDGTIVSTSASPTPGVAADVSVRFLGASANNDILGPSDGNVVVNTNALSTGADLVAPKVVSMSAISGAYQVGAVLDIKVSFNEVVVVDAVGGVPTLTLSAGGIELPVNASYVSGTGTKSLTFRYEISEGDPVASGLDVTRINFNGGSVTDLSGNVANVAVIADQNNLAPYASVSIDGESTSTETGGQTGGGQTGGGDVTDVTDETAAFIEQIQSVSGDGTFKAGESVTLRVHLNEVVTVDTTLGSPILVLSNGGVAQYVSGSESDALLFKYTVAPTDRNTTDLAVLGLAENDALIYDAGGNTTDVRVTSANNLSVFNDVIINARAPYVRTIDAFDDTYIPGDAIDFTVTFSEAVEVLGTGSPVLELSNGGVAHYVSGAPSNTLLFRYTVEGTDQSSSDLDVSGLRIPSGSELVSISSQNAASTVLKDGILSLSSDVEIDTVLPQGTVSLSGDHLVDGILRAGESATVTVVFAEPVENPRDAITVRNGTLSDLVTDETAESGLVWKGTFTPSLNIESAQNALVLDNSAVRDASGNAGLGLSTSLDFAIDTVGPSARMSSQTLENGKRLFTLDFEEDVSALETSFLAVSGGTKGVLTKVSESVYTLLVEPLEDNSAEEVTVTLMSGAVTDLAGNSNSVQTVVRAWDETPPRIVSMSAFDGSYTSGDAVDITVTFNEVVNVSTAGGVPVLALDNGRQAHYVSGSGSATGELVFRYMVEAGDEATDLDVLALIENGGGIQDRAGNPAYVAITPGVNNLASDASIVIDGVVPSISTISAADGLYTPGDLIEIEVQFSEAVDVDETAGSPILALSNGAYAQYVGGSGTSYLQFEYEVALEDNDATDLDVLGFAENGAVLTDASGNAANVTIRSEINSLSYRSDVSIDSALPQIAEISANEGRYKSGDVIEIAVALSKGVAIDTTQGEPSLELSNGSIATYTPELSSTSKLVFTYVVTSDDTQTDDLQVADFRDGNATFVGLISGGIADMSLPDGAMSSGDGVVGIDLTPPEVVEIAVADTALQAGESTTVTVTLNEPVKQLDVSFFSVDHGTLSAFESADGGVTWTSTYRPVRDIEDGEVVISLDGSKVSDEAGNLGSETAQSEAFNLDSLHPTIALRADHEGIANGPVRFVLNFSESVSGFSAEDLTIENGTLDELSFEGPDAGRPVGEYSFIVAPLENSVQPIKVRVGENKAFDLAGNGNALSPVYVQPVDTLKARIESIESPDGAYKVGDLINLDVTFSEAVSLHLKDGISEHELPELFLNNGQTAQYVAGSDSAVWTFQYQVAEVVDIDGSLQDIDVDPLKVLGLLENDTFLLDQAGNRTIVDVASDNSNGLAEGVVVDTTAPVITSFSAIDSAPYVLEDIIYIRAHLSEVVNLDFSAGRPVLELSNGGRASYVSGAGSKGLLFKYVVSDAETDAADLGVTAFDLNGALALDLAGNSIDGAISTANDLSTWRNVQIDTTAPELSIVRLVEDAGTVTDVANDGYYTAGTTLAFDVDFDDVVRVDTTNGSPQLTLSNGQTAQYVGGSESATLRFEYTVAQSDINTRSLKVVGLSEQGSVITDHAGNSALVEITDNNLQYNTAVIDTKEIEASTTSDSFAENADGEDIINTTDTVTFSFEFDGIVDLLLPLGAEFDPLDPASVADFVVAHQSELQDLFAVALASVDANIHTRVDENGDLLSDPNAGLAVQNFRFEQDEDGALDLTTFSVDVEIPDRTYADLSVTLGAGSVSDLAQNVLVSDITHTQRVDTQTVDLITTPTAGLFIGAQSTVRVTDLNGDLLASEVTLDPATGQAVVSIIPNETYPGGYRGPVTIEVIDTDPNPDYIDEYTGEAVTLSDGTSAFVMRAVYTIEAPGEVRVTVSPVTELAVTKLHEAMTEAGETALDAQKVSDFNAGIGKIFGVEDIVRTAATVVNSALVESSTGADVVDFDTSDGINASEKYGQVLAMLSARDSQSGSLSATIAELASDIKSLETNGQTTLAIKQSGADKLATALDSSSENADLDTVGVNRSLLDVAYIDEAAASGFGLNLAEAETTTVPVKGAQVGDTAFIQWGVITHPDLEAGEVAGAPNRFEVVIDETHVQADGSIRVAVPLSVIEKQGDATEVAVSTAVVPAGTTDVDGNPVTEPSDSDYRAPVLLTVDIIPPQTTVEAPDASAPFTTVGAVEGIRGGDDLNVLLNNSADDHFKYALSTGFLSAYETAYQEAYDAALVANPSATEAELKALAEAAGLSASADQVPTGLSVSNIVQDPASGTWQFDWELDLTTAISVAEEAAVVAAVEAGESYTPVPTFTPDDEKAVFQVQASTADLVGNADADDARNTVIIGSVDDVVDTVEEKAIMDQALNRLSERFGDAAVDTRAEIKVIAEAIDGINTLKAGVDPATIATGLVRAEQRLPFGTGGSAGSAGAVAAGVHSLAIGEDSFTIDLSAVGSPTVDDIIAAITSDPAYTAAAYTVERDASGNGVDIAWKSFGPQPDVVASVEVTSMVQADQLSGTISNPGGLVSFAVQDIPVEGELVDGAFVPSKGDITVGFGGVDLTVAVSEGETLADALVGLQSDDNYAALPFRLAVNAQGDGFVATWKATQTDPVTEQITVDRSYEVTTTTETTAASVVAGTAGVTTQELQSLDIQNVDDRDMAAVNRVLASDLAQASAPTVSFDQSALAAGETSRVSMTFATRVGQVPDDALALVGGSLSTEGDVDDPVWSSADGLTWTATFTASSLIPNTAFSYTEELDARGDVVVDAAGNPVLVATIADDATDPVTYAGVDTSISQIAMTEALVNRVTGATNKVANFAAEQDGSPAPMPSVQDFADMAVAGVDATNLSAVNDALLTIRDRFETAGDVHTQMNRVVESYNAVFDTVLAPAGVTQPLAADLVEDFQNLGVSNLSSDSARAEDQLTLLQGAMQAVAAAKSDIANEDGTTTTAADQQVDMINSVAKLESFVESVEKVLARSNGESVDIDGTATPIEVSADDFTALGFEDLLADTSANSRLSSLQKVLLDQSEGTGSAAVVSYADLTSVLEEASNSFDAIVGLSSVAQDTSYADDAARSAAINAALAAVDADNFQSMGVDGVTDVAIGSLTAAAMSDAVKDALANTENSIDSLEAIQKVVDSYTQVLSVASGDVTGATAVINDAEFADLGVTLADSDAEEPADVAHLLSGVIANKAAPASGATTDNVDSVAEVQALADAAKRVFDNANQTSDDGGANASEADLNTLGFDAVDADNIDAIQRVLTRTSDRDGVVDYTDLKAKVDAAVDAHTALTGVVAVAQGNATPDLSGLDETTFADMGVDHVGVGNVAAMLDALSNVDRAIITAVDVQAVVDSYNVLLDLGSYDSSDTDATVPASATATDLTNIGVELQTGTEDAVAELATGIVSNLALDAVDTVAEAQAIVDAIDAVFANTLRSGEDDTTHTVVASKDQLHTLGFASVSDDNLDAVQRVLSDQTDESDVKSYTDLKSLIDAAVTAHADVLNAASTDDLTGIDAVDYAAMGIDGVDETNIASINDALINTANALSTAATVQEVVDSYNHILDLRDAGTGITLDAADFMDLGVTLKAAGSEQDQQVAYLQEVVAKDLGNGDITTVSGLQDLANATSDLIDLIQGNSPDSDGVDGLTVAQLALLGVTAADAEEAGMISARLARTADDLSDVTNLETDLAARVQEARDALNVITRYANEDGIDPNGDTGSDTVDFFVYDRPVYTFRNNTYDFDPTFYVRLDNIETGKSITLNFNNGTSDVSVTKTYTGDGSDSSKAYFMSDMLNSPELSGIKSDALLGWSNYIVSPLSSTYLHDNGITDGQYNQEDRNIGGVENGKWMRIELNIDDSNFNNINANTYDVSNWSGSITAPILNPFEIPTPGDFLNIGVNGYAVQKTVNDTLTEAGGSLVLDGMVEEKSYHFDDYNMIEKFRSTSDDPSQESYYLLDLTKDGTIGSADADVKDNVNFNPAGGFGGYWTSYWVGNVDEVKQLLQNNADLQVEGVYYDVGLGTYNSSAGEHGPIVVSWQNGQPVREVVTNDTPRVYIVQPSDPTQWATSITTSGASYTAGRGDVHVFDISHASFDGVTFGLTDPNGDQGALLTLTGTPGQAGASLSVSIPSNQSDDLTLTTSTGGTFALSVVDGTVVPIDTSNIASINELFAATAVGADEGDDPATVRSEIQYVIDQNVGRLGALAKISAYAQANVLTPADNTLIPDAADFAAAGVSGVTDANNIPALLVKLAALGTSSNAAAADTAAELQGFVKQVAIEKIKAWTDTDGGNGSAPILQDYLNADLVSYDDAAITEAMVPSLNELFAGSLTSAGDADDQTEQQAVIDGAASLLAAMAKIADYADADGAIDFSDPADGVNDHLTVADFEAAGISGVGDGTNVSTGSGTSASSTYNNLEAVLSKLAQSDIAYLNADTVGEVQQLVADVAVEKINSYADADGVLGLVNETITVYVDVKTSDHPEQGGSSNAFYLDNVEAPALDLKAGTYTFDQSEPSNATHPLNIYANGDKSGTLPAGITVTQTGTPGQAGAQTVVVIDADFSGTVSYQCDSHAYMGNSAEVEMPYFTPELQDYTNAGLVEDSTAGSPVAINANQVPFVNALFARSDVGGTLANSDTYHADTQANQQDAIDQFGASMLALEKFVDYMLTENGVVKADFTAQDFVDAGLARVGVSNFSAILDRLPSYETSDTLVRNDLDSVEKIQAFVSRAIIAEYNADQANQAPVGDDYVAAGITGADADNAAAMNYQVANNGAYADTIAALEGLVTPAEAAITKLATDDLSHIEPISNDSQITLGRSHDGSSFVPHALELSDFGEYADPSSDALASIKITTLPAAGVIALDGSAITAGASISVQDINDGKLTYTPVDTTGAVSLEYVVIDDQGNESAVDYTLSIDRLDASPATGIANSGLLQTDAAVYSSPVYVGDALTGFDGMSSLRVVISATGGNVKINNADLSASGARQITTGFDYATSGGDEICIEGTEAQINAALKVLRTQITSGQEKVDISIDVQPGGMVYNPENGHFYEYVASSGITWTNAKTAAEGRTFEGMTGYLATPTSAEENAFIASKVNAQAWIGASDEGSEGVWEWATGPEAGTTFFNQPYNASGGTTVTGQYSNWASNEPNDFGSSVGGENYAHYLSSGLWNDYPNYSGSIQGYMVEYGGMSGDVSTVKSGVRTLTVYATEALGNVDMTLADFAQAGVTGVTANNLASVNQVLSTKSAADTDTNPKLQAIIDDTIAAIAKIEDYNNAANGVTSLDETDYAAAGITGVTADNVAAINTAVSALSAGGADTTSEIQEVVSQVRIEAYSDATASTSPMPEAPTVADYHALGIYSVDASNVSGVNTFVFDAATTLAEDTAEIALLVQEALELQPLLDAIAKISAYADADGVGVAAPTLDDYVAAQLTGVTQYNVGMANALFADTNVGTGDTTSALTQSDQQTVLTAASAKLASYSKIVSYADNDAGPQPTLTDYTNIGLQNFPSDYVSLINAKLVTAGIGIAEVDELSELEAMASQIKITEYANANGLAADGTTALSGDFVPTVNDYANIGVTEIFDGADMVAVDGSNVEQLNDLMAMRYIGNPDADGDGSTAAQGDTDERVDVVNNATDAATNETNLDYAGTVNTASEIEDVIAKAMGDKADADGGTFGTRAGALNKISQFADAVSSLADKAAYDAYIADGNNAAGIPDAQDYNNAGVLDLSDNTAGITDALVVAINYKLFEGGASLTDNTVGELQPYVDSANEIVNKIQAWAEPDWSGIGTSESYVSLVPAFENPDFEAASGTNIPGWNVVNERIYLGTSEIAGLTTPTDVLGTDTSLYADTIVLSTNAQATAPSGYKTPDRVTSDDVVLNAGDIIASTTAKSQNGDVDIQLVVGGPSMKTGGGIVHGPAIYSEGNVKLRAGDSVSVDFRAVAGGDAPDVFGYIQNVVNGDSISLVDYTGVNGVTSEWMRSTVTVPVDKAGEYRFVFIGGSYDYNNGTAWGATFEIDNVLVSSPPQKFNGIVSTNDESDYINTQSVFDGEGFVDANSLAFTSATTASIGNEIELGWYDQGDFGFDQAVVDHLIIHPKNAGTDFSKLPTDFDVMGWDNAAGQWEHIKTFSPASVESATVTTIGDASTNEVQTLTAPTVNDNGYYTLEIGSDRVVVQLDATATIAELATALDAALTTESIGVTVTASGNDLTLTWDTQATVSDSAKLTTQSVVESSDGKALEFDLSDSTRAYTGFKVVVRDTLGGDGTVEITELDFKAKQVTTADLPANSEPTFEEYNAIGFPEVTAANVADINALVFAKESAADLATLPQIKSVIDNYLTAMGRIESFANGDGSADTDGDFTADSGETGVPTVADYQAIGVRYVVNDDGLNIPISPSNIAAINEVIAQTVYGDDSGDTTITTAAELRTVLNSDAVAARLTAIDKISTLATATASSITLSATGFNVETSTNDIVKLDLVGPYGTETLSATYSTELNLTGLLAASLTSDSAYTIAVDGSGNTVISRADGQAFSVVVNAGSVGNWTLTDTADNTRTLSNDNDTIAVAGTGEAITVSDFAAAGVSGVTANNVQLSVSDLAAKAQNGDLDTQSEIQAVVDGAVAVTELLTFISDGELYEEIGTSYNYARKNFDDNEVTSSGYYLWDVDEPQTYGRQLDAKFAFDGDTSTTNGWWVSEREDVGGNDEHFGIFGSANYQSYIGYIDSDNSEGPTLLKSVQFNYLVSNNTYTRYVGRIQGYDESKGIWVTIDDFDTGGTSTTGVKSYSLDIASQYGSTIEKVAYTGYRLVFDEAQGAFGPRLDITEVDIQATKVLPLATPETFTTAGIDGVTDDNVDQVRKKVLDDTASDSTIGDISTVVSGVLQGLTALKTALSDGNADTLSASTYSDVGIDGVTTDNVDAVNTIAANRQANLSSGDTLSISDLQRIADDVSTNFAALLDLADLLSQQGDKTAFAQTLLQADRSYVPDLDSVNSTDAQLAIKKLLGLGSTDPVTDSEGLGIVAKEIYALAPTDGNGEAVSDPVLSDPADTTEGYSPWEAFNGLTSGDAEGYASTAFVSSGRPGSLGWFDSQKTQGPSVISSFTIDAVENKMPTVFDLYGYNSATQVWEFVQGYDISSTYTNETSKTFEVDTFRAYSGFRLDIFAPSTIDSTGTLPDTDRIEAVDSDIIINELTFKVDSSAVVVNAGLSGITDAETLSRVLDAISTAKTADTSNTDSLAKVKAIAQDVYTDIANEADFLGVDINEDQDYVDAYETATNGVVGNNDGDTANGDDTISVYLDVSDASVGDVIELYVDGTLIATSASLTQTQITNGALELETSGGASEFDLDSSDNDADDKVLLEVKVKNGSDVYVQDNGDVTWEYQW